MKYLLPLCILLLSIGCQPQEKEEITIAKSTKYSDLESLFTEWRAFENPPKLDGAPDYRKETFKKRWPEFEIFRKKLLAIDTTGWPVPNQVDWMVAWGEINGYEFNNNILKPWERDPAYYKTIWTEKSDVPAHEGPTHHGVLELWMYEFPLNSESRNKFLKELKVVSSINKQAKLNLTGNAKDLWITGIRDIRFQSNDLKEILELPGIKDDAEIVETLDKAIESNEGLVSWLESKSSEKTGPSGIGKDNYTWYLQNVHLVPLTWEDEVLLMKREVARAWSSLKLEEHKNRNLPELELVKSPEEFDKLALKSANKLLEFLEVDSILTVKDYFEPALMEKLGSYSPPEKRNFFTIGTHYDPTPLYSHFYHWFELARVKYEPNKSLIRSSPILYNMYDSRNEGTATAVEEIFMQAGLYEDNPRVKEIVYIMIAQRAARGLGSLYAHANEMTMEEAGGVHSNYTPRGWMKTEKDLKIFEQHLYLRQPGYGTSYITGKYLLEDAMANYARIKELKNEDFKLLEFFDQLNAIGNIPVALSQWEMTGEVGHLKEIRK